MEARRARTIDELTRTLGSERMSAAHGETLRRGTLVLESGERRSGGHVDADFASLPRLDLGDTGDVPTLTPSELELGKLLGAGGMGAVWLARQRSLRRDVAIKRLKEGPEGTQGAAALLAEARTTGALEHPSIVPVHVLGLDARGQPLLVMKRIEGATLEALMREPEHETWSVLESRHGDRTTAQCEILMRVADALHFAHSRGYFHRDVKPANVMVGTFGEVYLVDWGVALAPDEPNAEREIVGTASFMAPEMVQGDPGLVDARTDVYLLGATLHALLTGAPRHDGEMLAAVLYAALLSQPATYDASIDAGLGAIANRATSLSPEERYPSALAFGDALAQHLRHRGSVALVDAAREKLAALEKEALTPARHADPSVTVVLHECRFGLEQALRTWDENPRARETLDRTLVLMLEGELARRSPAGARAVLSAMKRSDGSLEARITALEKELAAGKLLEEEARAERHERSFDPSSRGRVSYTLVVIALSVLLFALALWDEARNAAPVPMTRVVPGDVGMLGIMAIGLWVMRKRLLTNRISRQLGSLALLALLSSTLVDAIHASRGETSREAGSVSVMVIGSVYLGAAIGIGGRLWVAAIMCYVAGIVAWIWPTTATACVGFGIIGCLVALVYDGLGARRAVPRD